MPAIPLSLPIHSNWKRSRLEESNWPPMNADERILNASTSSVVISAYQRLSET